jgi:succinoglycan biosynthesis protein ExoM
LWVAFRPGEQIERLLRLYGKLVEPIRGLARVRNRAVAASNLKYLAFIDDDQCASRRWLVSLYQMAIKTNAAAVVGRTTVLFDRQVPDFIRACSHFNPKACGDGEVVPWYLGRVANCIIRRDALPHARAPFSTCFDLTGGEDIDLYYRMIENGAHVVAAAQAQTASYYPASRANLLWVMRRALRNGGTLVEIRWYPCNWRRSVLNGWHAGVQGTKWFFRAAAVQLWRNDKTAALQYLVWACMDFGKVLRLLGIRVKEYRHHH